LARKEVPREPLEEIAQGFQRFRILATAVDLRLFTVIDHRSVTVGDVTSLLEIEERPARIFLNALAAMGLLEIRRGRYRVAAVAREYLVEGTPRFYGDLLRMLDRRVWDGYRRLEWSLRNNRPVAADPAIGDTFQTMARDPAAVRTFILGMHSVGAETARRLTGRLDLSRQRHVLDVGGGSGVYSIAFARKNPRLRATVFDLPHVLEIAREKIDEAGLGTRVLRVAGDFFKDPWPTGADAVFLSYILHDWSPGTCRDLLRKAAGVLPAGGLLILRELFRDDDGPGPPNAAIGSVTMLVETEGENYSWSTYESWLREAGFGRFRRVRLGPSSSGSGALLARRLPGSAQSRPVPTP
jgi:ubiquinone/menaquinone biosynthesis C-methylase UbiE